ncbi:MAG: hypothetical protein EB147_07675 [Acidimicrobiia bacterium]|nr:hypothetical protein [Acidimicrobiia bacterium]
MHHGHVDGHPEVLQLHENLGAHSRLAILLRVNDDAEVRQGRSSALHHRITDGEHVVMRWRGRGHRRHRVRWLGVLGRRRGGREVFQHVGDRLFALVETGLHVVLLQFRRDETDSGEHG